MRRRPGGAPDPRRGGICAARFVFPGWADAHLHLLELGQSLESADLRDAASADEAAARMAAAAGRLPEDAWVEGFGWDQNRWPGAAFPDARALDRRRARPARRGRTRRRPRPLDQLGRALGRGDHGRDAGSRGRTHRPTRRRIAVRRPHRPGAGARPPRPAEGLGLRPRAPDSSGRRRVRARRI